MSFGILGCSLTRSCPCLPQVTNCSLIEQPPRANDVVLATSPSLYVSLSRSALLWGAERAESPLARVKELEWPGSGERIPNRTDTVTNLGRRFIERRFQKPVFGTFEAYSGRFPVRKADICNWLHVRVHVHVIASAHSAH